MKEYWGSEGIAPYIFDLGTRWSTARPLYPKGKVPWYQLDRGLGGPQNRSGRGGEEKNSQHIPGVESPIIEPVAQRYTSELSQLHVCFLRYVNVFSFLGVALLPSAGDRLAFY
jgi:hypothetical protein